VPDIWKSAIVIPAPKVHPIQKTIFSDLRPISLLPVLGKILESFVADWLCEFLAPTLDPNQFGGLKGRSAAHALVSILHSWCSTVDKGGSVRALFVNFTKAFDRGPMIISLVFVKYSISNFLTYSSPNSRTMGYHIASSNGSTPT